jgi:GT2 family glycosyltransferase
VSSSSRLGRIGVVAIGRNEGERLRRCLESIPSEVGAIVYVDSGSTDGSCELARARGVEAVELDMSIPFTAARARNAGFERLSQILPNVTYVQFLDGDCVLAPDWLERAGEVLDHDPTVVAVWGHLYEIHPEASIYNRLCQAEWAEIPVGETRAFGGNVAIRTKAFAAVRGFTPSIIAGEEHDLAVRLRRAGGHIRRIDADMAFHDAAITRFSQWWRRSVRTGHAYTQIAALHGPRDGYFVPQRRRIFLWGGLVPALAILALVPSEGWSLALFGLYPIRFLRAAAAGRRMKLPLGDALLWAAFCILGSFPQMIGQAQYYANALRGVRSTLIEYK